MSFRVGFSGLAVRFCKVIMKKQGSSGEKAILALVMHLAFL